LFDPGNGAHWKPTKKPIAPDVRSYHLSALYSPPGMYPWEAVVGDWLQAYDEENARPRDITLLQVFYNNNLGESFEVVGDRLRFATVSAHRRHEYRFGDIPNTFAATVAGGNVVILTCAVDVHADNMAVAVIGWTRGQRAFVIDYWRFVGDTEQVDNPDTWGRLQTLIETKEYVGDDGKRYRIALTLIDSGYRADQTYQFCSQYESGVYPIKGVEQPPKSAKVLEFSEFTSRLGTRAFNITVNIYKDRWSASLRRGWDKTGPQPPTYFNAPSDITDKQLRELTVEQRVEKTDDATGRSLGFEWKRPSGSRNELWDLLVYNNAALEMVAHSICVVEMEREFVNWSELWDVLEQGRYYSQA
jgi:phage terminase large subunit GpA-like protein